MESFDDMRTRTLEEGSEEFLEETEVEYFAGTPSRVSDGMFISYIRKYGTILLSKSQKPYDKNKKKQAAEKISHQLQVDKGICYSPQQIFKKVQNLKSKLNSKADVSRTGNRKITLSAAEKELSELIHAADNPAVNPLKSEIVLDSSTITEVADVDSEQKNYDANFLTPKQVLTLPNDEKLSTYSSASRNVPRKTPQKKIENVNVYNQLETQETNGLILELLQRLVLLKQLKVFEKQERLIDKQEKIADKQLEGCSNL